MMNSPNNPSPLVPQGSLLEQKNASRSRVKVAFFCVVGVHVFGLMVLLMQGCKREQPAPPVDPGTAPTANVVPQDIASNPPPPEVVGTNAAPVEPTQPVQPLQPVAPPQPPAGVAQEYTVQKGDSFYSIAKNFHVTQKAIQDANPTVVPLKMQVGQKLTIPAPAPAAVAPTAGTPTATGDTGADTYVVKSGDALERIAHNHSTTVKAIMALNNLPDTKIKVGQKLKMPAKSATPTAAPPPAPQ